MLEREDWEHRGGLVFSYDYPILFWMSVLFGEGARTVFDFGGSVGVHFYGYSSRLCFPSDLEWTICEVPEVVEVGAALAATRGAGLGFTTSFADADGQDLLLASGSVQYVRDLGPMLRRLQRPPRHLLLNRLPIHDGPRFVTLQNEGSAFGVQHIFNWAEFVASLATVGYKLVDSWASPEEGCSIPFRDITVAPYRGMYFRR
jgi:putative methyltransferase (TIGR04325 family)